MVRRTSPGLSSTSKISIGLPFAISFIAVWSPSREREIKRTAPPPFGLDPDSSAVTLHDLLGDGEANAAAGIIMPIVQALKDQKDALEVLRLNANAIILDPEQPLIPLLLCPHVDSNRAVAAELNRIAD